MLLIFQKGVLQKNWVHNPKFLVSHFYMVEAYTEWGTLLVAQLVDALCYKPEGRNFDSRWCHWNFSLA
jgi:hypothetical protein